MILFYTLFSFPFYGLFLHVIKILTFTLFRLPSGSKDCVMRSTNLCVGGSDALLTYKWWWHHLLNQIALEKVRRFYCVLYKEGVLYHSNKKKVLVSYWRKTVHSQTIVIEKWEVYGPLPVVWFWGLSNWQNKKKPVMTISRQTKTSNHPEFSLCSVFSLHFFSVLKKLDWLGRAGFFLYTWFCEIRWPFCCHIRYRWPVTLYACKLKFDRLISKGRGLWLSLYFLAYHD